MTLTIRAVPVLLSVVAAGLCATPASAQSFSFDRTLPATAPVVVEIVTGDGEVNVRGGGDGQVRVRGAAHVRVGWNVPADALAIARATADAPPIDVTPTAIRLTRPTTAQAQRAVRITWEVDVPAGTRVQVRTQSGAASISGVTGDVTLHTQSGALEASRIAGPLVVESGSGSVRIAEVNGDAQVTTTSGGITAHGIGAGLKVRTGSGAVEAAFTGAGDADIETRSSSVEASDVRGPLTVSTGSGRVRVQLASGAPATLDVSTRSGSVVVPDALTGGSVEKRHASGSIHGGGPTISLHSRSGSIDVR